MGGNVCIKTDSGSHFASDIDLRIIRRSEIVTVLLKSLSKLNGEFNLRFGFDLWNQELLSTLDFFSGSSRHFFDLSIDDHLFSSIKPTVGDIDTQVPSQYQYELEYILEDNIQCGDITLIGFKKSAGQLISLWKSKTLDQNIQIDFELVEFKNGFPTKWAQFSHSSSFIDMNVGIKGVMHKHALRALTTKTLDSYVVLRGKKKTETIMVSTLQAFSVQRGLRTKSRPLLIDNQPKTKFGLPVMEEIPIEESIFITEPSDLFLSFFGFHASPEEVKKLWSFVGILDMVNTYWKDEDVVNFTNGFLNTLWGDTAQMLYRDAKKDEREKDVAFFFLINKLDVRIDINDINTLKHSYYLRKSK